MYFYIMIIIPSGLLDTIVQSSGGTTVQNGYGGLQLHKKAYQRKVKSFAQQQQRNNFTVAQTGWSDLTPTQQATWYAAAVPPQSGFELYSSTNNTLVASGIDIIPEYVTPVTPPTNDLVFGSANWAYPPDPPSAGLVFTSAGNNIPTSGWTPYVLWTKWIRPSVYRFPEIRFLVPTAAVGITSGEYAIQLEEDEGVDMTNFQVGAKAKLILQLINNTTGQIFTYLTYEATAQ